MPQFIDMSPAPSLVRAALAHCEIPLDYTDDHGVKIPAGPGFDSNGFMTIPDDHVLREILSAVLTVAMVKHLEDTMVLPSNVSRLRQQASFLSDIAFSFPPDDEDHDEKGALEGIAETLRGIADNLDPANR